MHNWSQFGKRKNVPKLEEDNAQEVIENANEDGENQPKARKNRQMSTLNSDIHRRKVRQHKFVMSKKTDEELFNMETQIRPGPAFKELNENDENIEVKGGDETKALIQDFFCLLEVLRKNLADKGYVEPTKIQKCVIPIILKKKYYDLMARSPTGTGKTEAFFLPIIHLLEKRKRKPRKGAEVNSEQCAPNVIVIAPTRELAQQLSDSARTFSRGTSLKVVCSYGEMSVSESVEELKKGCDIFVGTIGRLKQFLCEEKIKLTDLNFLVLDEADRLLKDHITRQNILELHNEAKNLDRHHRIFLFSATFDGIVVQFADEILRPNYFFVSAIDRALPLTVKQEFYRLLKLEKFLGIEEILNEMRTGIAYSDKNGVRWHRLKEKVLIFCNSRRRSNWLSLKLCLKRFKAIPTSGDRTQKQRQEALNELEKGDCDILVSTNVTSRGLNIFGIGLVVNYEMPKNFDEFVHRTGRTGRAGNSGRAISFIDDDNPDDQKMAAQLAMELQNNGMEIPEVLIEYAREYGLKLKNMGE